ncbi:MAG: ABC transporter permease [Eubacteriaceae bacterium]
MFDSLKVLISKELKRVFTDKRLVFTTLILPPIMIIVIYWVMGVGLQSFMSDIEEHTPIVYVMNAPDDFVEHLETESMEVNYIDSEDNTEKIKDSILHGEIDVLLIFDKNFVNQVNNYKESDSIAQVETYYNTSEEYSSAANSMMQGVLNQYEQSLLGQRFGNVEYADAFNMSENIIVDDKKADGQMLAMILPMMITIFLFAGSMGIGADSIAGEKERGTMATLLLTPVKRQVIAFGKIISLSIVAFASALSSFIGIVIAFPLLLSSAGGMNINISSFINYSFIDYILILLVLVALEGVFVGLISITSVVANSVKEASTYMMPIYMIVMISAFANMFSAATSSLVQYFIPIYGSVIALKDVFSFNINITGLIINVVVSICFTFILVYIINKLFDSEKVMFSA